MITLLLVALVLAVVAIVMLLVRHAVYRSTHGYTEGDIASARRDALVRSRNVVSGKVQEHLVPFFPEFLGMFNPRDARFLGSPIDFVVFTGLDEGEECREVVLVEVKTGKSPLTKRGTSGSRRCRSRPRLIPAYPAQAVARERAGNGGRDRWRAGACRRWREGRLGSAPRPAERVVKADTSSRLETVTTEGARTIII